MGGTAGAVGGVPEAGSWEDLGMHVPATASAAVGGDRRQGRKLLIAIVNTVKVSW